MSVETFLIVLFAAFLHALWNAIVKGAGDRALVLGLVALGHVVPGVFLALYYGVPDPAAFPYVVATTVIHWGYYILLNVAYRTGDLSVVYPIARGLAPILIALGAVIWADEHLPLMAWIGILAVSGGILLLARQAISSTLARTGLVAAIGVAVVIASYSIVDGIGVRVSGNPGGYIGWIFTAEIFVVLFVFATRWERFRAMPPRAVAVGFAGGLVSSAAYGLVLLAKTEAPLGIVSALRETSVIFAALIGILWFSEGPRRDRLIAALIVAAGIGIISSARI
ncbi:MAG: DMT family transporter [Pseudomonadota bacterium]